MNSTSQISQLSRFREKVSIASGIARLTGSFVSVLFYSCDSAIYIIYMYVCVSSSCICIQMSPIIFKKKRTKVTC